VAAGAVLICAIGAAAIGLIVLGPPLAAVVCRHAHLALAAQRG